ncbi:hypothetical protein HNQ07_003645 [Deinococcus metalli]|uniref:Uncharacterized protein n=1 Tax=Deinococcus metalli TaxID=1141878 RepID=A0A7W8KH78_9DEIO|nr:hypothetical protein [Deinococcus metalli]MBB5378144.1 hypothetical protein [Deinococcus metalli]GHF56348.1 hypothetical protein GCM10017781_35830 [Deinococcus metalli]
MTSLPVTLTQLSHLLPPDSRNHLALLDDVCPGIICVVSGQGGEPRFTLEVEVAGRMLRTGGHRRVHAGLVDELSALVSGHLGRVI